MSSDKDVAINLMRRLLAGERGLAQSHLARLLERSSSLHDSDELYRSILPPELADIRLSKETCDEVVSTLCAEISRNPDEALISAISFSGADLATKTVAEVLASPPRPLTMSEYAYSLSLVSKFLGFCLQEDPEFLSKEDVARLVQLAKKLEEIEDDESERALRVEVKHHASNLLRSLAHLGIA